MSIRIMTQVWAIPLPDSQKLVLLALADNANDAGKCWPSMRHLVEKCSKGERTIQGVIKQLEARGHLSRREKLGKGVIYTVHPRSDCAPTPAAAAPRRDCAPAKAAPPQRLRPTPAAAADKPSRTTIGIGSSEPIPANPFSGAAWDGWIEMRKRARKAPTPRAIEQAIATLSKLEAKGHDPTAVLDQSTFNNWAGLFPLKEEHQDGRRQRTADQPATLGPTTRAAQRFVDDIERMGAGRRPSADRPG